MRCLRGLPSKSQAAGGTVGRLAGVLVRVLSPIRCSHHQVLKRAAWALAFLGAFPWEIWPQGKLSEGLLPFVGGRVRVVRSHKHRIGIDAPEVRKGTAVAGAVDQPIGCCSVESLVVIDQQVGAADRPVGGTHQSISMGA